MMCPDVLITVYREVKVGPETRQSPLAMTA